MLEDLRGVGGIFNVYWVTPTPGLGKYPFFYAGGGDANKGEFVSAGAEAPGRHGGVVGEAVCAGSRQADT